MTPVRTLACTLFATAVVTCLPSRAEATLYLYAELVESFSGDNITLTAYGSVEDPECMGSVRATVRVHDPNGTIKAGKVESGYCYAEASASYTQLMTTVVDGDWEARTIGLGPDQYHACQINTKNLETFRAVWQYSHYNVLIGKHEYQSNSSVCVGKCQPPRFCSTTQANWAMRPGVKISVPVASYCKFAGGTFYSSTQPACKQRFGTYIGGWNGDCN